ncbi:MAG: hypothetical protein EZS28_006056 [Streblomastix strix]|uniref:Uncharacterized protein n=1 Tax=Streblomastix strix TaxID=222440 RepID=A0A5J4WU05_9EUKA|nr:MAG: hypothetical protein EZS28_006056 [Streblomastix strix]
MENGNIQVTQVALGVNLTQIFLTMQETKAFPKSFKYHRIYTLLESWNQRQFCEFDTGREHSSEILVLDFDQFKYREVRFDSMTKSFRIEAQRLHALLVTDTTANYKRCNNFVDNEF